MANWAALQEQLTGKRVVKRAKHSIHFDNGNGSITANFSGKPCHYQDTDGLWKPIDTGLLLAGDGWYGSPHSDVKIHKDGRVKVGGYQQKSTLVNAKEGVVDGDKIVREFKFGTQYLYMTENGFRQETVIDRTPTTAEAKYLIASESGTLDSKYKRSNIAAVDADGDVHEFINLGQFKKWLDGAVYPVTIDPDFSVHPDETAGVDTWITSSSPDTNNGTATTLSVYGTNYHRSLIKFDLSTLAGTTISAATLELTTTNNKYSAVTLYIHRVLVGNAGWTEAGATWNKQDGTNSWAGSAGCSSSGTDYAAATLYALDPGGDANNQTKSLSLDTTEFTTLVSANYGMLLRIATAFGRKDWHSSSSSTASYRPKLVVTYTEASSGVPKHFLHYARLRSN